MTYTCPYCKTVCYDDGNVTSRYYQAHGGSGIHFVMVDDEDQTPDAVVVELSKCPNCSKVAVNMESYYKSRGFKFSFSYPPANAMSIPDYVPFAIREDYTEAVSIVETSPKASATLSRRCLQGMIHDFWGIKEKNLNAEITSLRAKIPAAQWSAIDALRKIGNIGAHMEKDINTIVDVDPSEAKSLLKLIELLIDKWYIARHDEEMLLSEITKMASEKESLRKPGVTNSDGQ